MLFLSAGQYRLYYDPEKAVEVEKRLTPGFVFHYFNKMRTKNLAQGEEEEFFMAKNQPLYKMMSKHCPETERVLLRPRLGQRY